MFKGWKTIVIKSDEEYEEEKRMARFNPSITKVIEDSQPADAMECGADGNIPEGRPLTKEATELFNTMLRIEERLQEGREARRQLAAAEEHGKRLEASLRLVEKQLNLARHVIKNNESYKDKLNQINAEQEKYIHELEKRLANGK